MGNTKSSSNKVGVSGMEKKNTAKDTKINRTGSTIDDNAAKWMLAERDIQFLCTQTGM